MTTYEVEGIGYDFIPTVLDRTVGVAGTWPGQGGGGDGAPRGRGSGMDAGPLG